MRLISRWMGGLMALAMAFPAAAQGGTPHFWPEGAHAPGDELRPPTELGGFTFGESLAQSRRQCRRAGHRFSERNGAYRCSGSPASLGFPAEVSLGYCDGRLCEVQAILQAPDTAPHFAAWAEAYGRLHRVLTAAFGEAQQNHWRAPEPCRRALQSGRSAACFTREGMRARHWWSAGGHELFLGVQRRRNGDGPELKLMFRAPARLAEISATSD